MGLWDLLTKDISFSRVDLKWSEPALYRIRLKKDLPWRVLLVLSCWLAATGGLLIIFSQNQNPTSPGLAWGLGVVFGLLPSAIFFFFRKDDVGGNIVITEGRIEVSRIYIGLTAQWTQTKVWDLGLTNRYHLCPAEQLGHSFHALFCKISGEWELLGVPEKIDLKKLSAVLAADGSEIKIVSKIPDKFTRGYSPAIAGGLSLVGAALLIVGFILYQPENGLQRPQEFADLPNPGFTEMQFPNTRPGANPTPGDSSTVDRPPSSTPESNVPGNNSFPIPGQGPSTTPTPQPGFSNRGNFQSPQVPSSSSNPFGPSSIPKASSPPTTVPNPTISSNTNQKVEVGTRSELIGGAGGFPFSQISPEQKPVLGIQVRMGSWAGIEHLGKVEALYQMARPTPNTTVIVAKSGYVLGGIEINAPKFVDGIRLVFMKQTKTGVDSSDHYQSNWIGIASLKPTRLEKEGKPSWTLWE
jgi:hypothetical protein